MNTFYTNYYHVNMETTKVYTDMNTGTEFKDNDGLSTTASFHDIDTGLVQR